MHHMLTPFNLVELSIVNSSKVHIEGVVFLSNNKGLDWLIEDRKWIVLLVWLIVLPETEPRDWLLISITLVVYLYVLTVALVSDQENISVNKCWERYLFKLNLGQVFSYKRSIFLVRYLNLTFLYMWQSIRYSLENFRH